MPVTGASSYWVILGHTEGPTEGPTGGRSGSPTGNHILGVGYTGYIGNEKNGNGNGNGNGTGGRVRFRTCWRTLRQPVVLFCVACRPTDHPDNGVCW